MQVHKVSNKKNVPNSILANVQNIEFIQPPSNHSKDEDYSHTPYTNITTIDKESRYFKNKTHARAASSNEQNKSIIKLHRPNHKPLMSISYKHPKDQNINDKPLVNKSIYESENLEVVARRPFSTVKMASNQNINQDPKPHHFIETSKNEEKIRTPSHKKNKVSTPVKVEIAEIISKHNSLASIHSNSYFNSINQNAFITSIHCDDNLMEEDEFECSSSPVSQHRTAREESIPRPVRDISPKFNEVKSSLEHHTPSSLLNSISTLEANRNNFDIIRKLLKTTERPQTPKDYGGRRQKLSPSFQRKFNKILKPAQGSNQYISEKSILRRNSFVIKMFKKERQKLREQKELQEAKKPSCILKDEDIQTAEPKNINQNLFRFQLQNSFLPSVPHSKMASPKKHGRNLIPYLLFKENTKEKKRLISMISHLQTTNNPNCSFNSPKNNMINPERDSHDIFPSSITPKIDSKSKSVQKGKTDQAGFQQYLEFNPKNNKNGFQHKVKLYKLQEKQGNPLDLSSDSLSRKLNKSETRAQMPKGVRNSDCLNQKSNTLLSNINSSITNLNKNNKASENDVTEYNNALINSEEYHPFEISQIRKTPKPLHSRKTSCCEFRKGKSHHLSHYYENKNFIEFNKLKFGRSESPKKNVHEEYSASSPVQETNSIKKDQSISTYGDIDDNPTFRIPSNENNVDFENLFPKEDEIMNSSLKYLLSNHKKRSNLLIQKKKKIAARHQNDLSLSPTYRSPGDEKKNIKYHAPQKSMEVINFRGNYKSTNSMAKKAEGDSAIFPFKANKKKNNLPILPKKYENTNFSVQQFYIQQTSDFDYSISISKPSNLLDPIQGEGGEVKDKYSKKNYERTKIEKINKYNLLQHLRELEQRKEAHINIIKEIRSKNQSNTSKKKKNKDYFNEASFSPWDIPEN